MKMTVNAMASNSGFLPENAAAGGVPDGQNAFWDMLLSLGEATRDIDKEGVMDEGDKTNEQTQTMISFGLLNGVPVLPFPCPQNDHVMMLNAERQKEAVKSMDKSGFNGLSPPYGKALSGTDADSLQQHEFTGGAGNLPVNIQDSCQTDLGGGDGSVLGLEKGQENPFEQTESADIWASSGGRIELNDGYDPLQAAKANSPADTEQRTDQGSTGSKHTKVLPQEDIVSVLPKSISDKRDSTYQAGWNVRETELKTDTDTAWRKGIDANVLGSAEIAKLGFPLQDAGPKTQIQWDTQLGNVLYKIKPAKLQDKAKQLGFQVDVSAGDAVQKESKADEKTAVFHVPGDESRSQSVRIEAGQSDGGAKEKEEDRESLSGGKSMGKLREMAVFSGYESKMDMVRGELFPEENIRSVSDSGFESVKNQITCEIAEASVATKKEVSIVLKPDRLGKIALVVVSDEAGVTAQIITDNVSVRDKLVEQSAIIRETLLDQGCRMNDIEVRYHANSGSLDSNGSDLFSGRDGQSRQHERQNQSFGSYRRTMKTKAAERSMVSGICEQETGFNYFA